MKLYRHYAWIVKALFVVKSLLIDYCIFTLCPIAVAGDIRIQGCEDMQDYGLCDQDFSIFMNILNVLPSFARYAWLHYCASQPLVAAATLLIEQSP